MARSIAESSMIEMPSRFQPCDEATASSSSLVSDSVVEALLVAALPFEQELHRQCRLADAGIALHEIEAVARQAAAQDVVEAGHAGAEFARDGIHGSQEVRKSPT